MSMPVSRDSFWDQHQMGLITERTLDVKWGKKQKKNSIYYFYYQFYLAILLLYIIGIHYIIVILTKLNTYTSVNPNFYFKYKNSRILEIFQMLERFRNIITIIG